MPKNSLYRWKESEREVARAFGTTRVPNNGYGQPDVVLPAAKGNPPIACQIKTKAVVPAWLLNAMKQAVVDCDAIEGDSVPAVVIVHARGAGHPRERFMVLRFDDAVRLMTEKADETPTQIIDAPTDTEAAAKEVSGG